MYKSDADNTSINTKQNNNQPALLMLFMQMFYISLFTFGGGFVIISLLRELYVIKLHLLSEEEVWDLVSIAQTGPGSVAVNMAILLGYKVAGFKGLLVAVSATILPPFIVILAVSYIYQFLLASQLFTATMQGIQVAVAAIIISVACDLLQIVWGKNKIRSTVIIALVLVFTAVFKVKLIFVIIALILLSSINFYYEHIRGNKD